MKINSNSNILYSLITILYISCGLVKEKSNLPIPENKIEQIVVGLNPNEIKIINESTINEITQILKKAYKSEINKSGNEIVRMQIKTFNPQNRQTYLLDTENEFVRVLSMKKTTKFKIDEFEKLRKLIMQ